LADKPIAQTVGLVAGTGAANTAEIAGADDLSAQGVGILTNILATRGFQNWGAVEKAIANGEIKDQDRAFLLKMAQKYPILTQSMFPLKGKTGQYAQRLAENTPFIGTSGQVAREAQGRQQAMKDVVDSSVGTEASGDKLRAGVTDLVENRGARLGELTGRKQVILDEAVKKGATAEVNDVSESLKTIAEIQKKLTEANNPAAFGGYIKKLSELADSLSSSNLRGIELNRKVISDMRKDASLGNIAKSIDPYTRNLYSSTAKSLTNSVRKTMGKEVGDEWEAINSQLSQDAGDLKNAAFKQAINRGQDNVNRIQGLVDYVEQNEDPRVVKNILKDMTPSGRRDLADGILINHMRKAGLSGEFGHVGGFIRVIRAGNLTCEFNNSVLLFLSLHLLLLLNQFCHFILLTN